MGPQRAVAGAVTKLVFVRPGRPNWAVLPFVVRGVWSGPRQAGLSAESVDAFVERLSRAGFNALFMELKRGDGSLCWPSQVRPEAVPPEYRTFDLPACLLDSCRKRGIALHAWFIDFMEGANGAAYRAHPEWAMVNAQGRPVQEEILRGKPSGWAWMCPARRPGYADQWLVPLYEEFASRYEVDSIHHDYVRYPGDMAPDQYCFCDYCLEQIPKQSGLISSAHSEEPFFHDLYDRPYLESHWEQSPRVLPANWERLPRAFKSRFLLEGGFFVGGRADLDYFYYTFRTQAINDFARLSHEAVKRANPNVDISGAVFKNPVQSGRFIGQDWRQFARHMEIAVPMDYRDHFPGTFEQYLDLLVETIESQKTWARECRSLYIGVAINFLFKEEPDGPYPSEKVTRVLERVASTGVEGVALFSVDLLDRYGMWDTVTSAFRP